MAVADSPHVAGYLKTYDIVLVRTLVYGVFSAASAGTTAIRAGAH